MKERRSQEERIEADVVVDYHGTHVVLYHTVRNLSLGGVCIESPSLEPIGKTVSLSLNFPDLDRTLDVRGEAVGVNEEPPQDMGIRFIELSESDKETIRHYIQLKSKA